MYMYGLDPIEQINEHEVAKDRCIMKHKVKVTVIDKSYIQNCSNSIARTLIRVLALL